MTQRKKSAARRGGGRVQNARVKSARGRKLSSTLWLKRQLNDPYVQAAQRDGYRSRAAYKLIELNDKYQFLKKAKTIVDLGAAPGGWTQVAVEMAPQAQVLALDINEMDEINGAQVMQGDIYDPAIIKAIKEALNGPVDLVLSDMAPPSSGHRSTDHLRIVGLVEAAFDLSTEILQPGGKFVAKTWQGGADNELLQAMRQKFRKVRHGKPKASRSDSAEMYLIAEEFIG